MDHQNKKILVIDDESVIRQIFSFYLEDRDFLVILAENGKRGIELFKEEQPDLVITDLRMPEVDGLDVLREIHEYNPNMPVIVISGANRMTDAIQALRLGAWDYLMKPVQDLDLLNHTVEACLDKAQLIRENQNYKEHLEELVQARTEELNIKNRQLDISRRQIIGILSQAAEYRDFETGVHFLRVSDMAACIGKGLGWDDEDVTILQLSSPVHDIGKIGIPDGILLKEGKLTEEEMVIMKKHCIFGKKILDSDHFINIYQGSQGSGFIDVKDMNNKLIETAAQIALSHHEFWNGEGYPMGLKGEDIPMVARITAIADVYDALMSKRPYKEPWEEKKTLNYIKKRSGIQFDPEVVKVFFENIDEIRKIQVKYQ